MRLRLLLSTGVLVLAAASARPDSSLVLPFPEALGPIPAGTYDVDGKRLGEAKLSYERRPDGKIHMRAVASVQNGARNVVHALFEEIEEGRSLRVLQESSLSYDAEGKPMILVEVDHEKGVGRCTPPAGGPEDVETVPLPQDDRVTNTTLELLFRPLAMREVETIDFQALLCQGGARVVDFVAVLADRSSREPSHQIVEVDFGPKLGRVLSWFARATVPDLRFWFDANQGLYVAHRMPLFNGGPEVVIAREGVASGPLER